MENEGRSKTKRLTVTEYTAIIAAIQAVNQAQATLKAIQDELGWLEGEEYDIQPDRFVTGVYTDLGG